MNIKVYNLEGVLESRCLWISWKAPWEKRAVEAQKEEGQCLWRGPSGVPLWAELGPPQILTPKGTVCGDGVYKEVTECEVR